MLLQRLLLIVAYKMLILVIVLVARLVDCQEIEVVPRTFVRTGRYNPQLFGGSGWYMPDDRGKYRHVPVKYDGGYGDRGSQYIPDSRSRYWQQQQGQAGSWEVPDSYEENAPYATSQYRPSPSVPNYVPQQWDPDRYAQDYQFNTDGFRIIQFQWSKDGKIRYSYLYETENKVLAEEFKKLAMVADKLPAVRVNGFYQYKGDDGVVYEVDYVANENGIFPKETHIHQSLEGVLGFLINNSTKVKK